MLKLMFPLMTLLLLPMISTMHMWLITSMLILITLLSSIMFVNYNTYLMVTNFTAMDTMSTTLIILSIWITAMMILASTKIFHTKSRSKAFISNTMILLIILIMCFASPNLLIFYIWFEASLIPTMILIMAWGYQPERAQASMYLMIYTVAASLPMLGAICKIYLNSKSCMMPMFMNMQFPLNYSFMPLAFLLSIGGFLVKLPMFTVHLWLPKAHVEAPIAGSMILAAILLKLGGYGILRMMSMFQHSSKSITSLLMAIALVGAVTTSLICFRQTDLKSLIAYSSVGHMGLMVAGAMMSSNWGYQAALAMMIAHGLSSSALFVMANINYELVQTRSLYLTKGLMTIFPILTMWWFMFTACNMAAPPSINLMAEIMLITAILSYSIYSIILLSLVSFFTAAYSLFMYTATHHGQPATSSNPLIMIKSKDYLLMIMHLAPIILLISKPELITNWN